MPIVIQAHLFQHVQIWAHLSILAQSPRLLLHLHHHLSTQCHHHRVTQATDLRVKDASFSFTCSTPSSSSASWLSDLFSLLHPHCHCSLSQSNWLDFLTVRIATPPHSPPHCHHKKPALLSMAIPPWRSPISLDLRNQPCCHTPLLQPFHRVPSLVSKAPAQSAPKALWGVISWPFCLHPTHPMLLLCQLLLQFS